MDIIAEHGWVYYINLTKGFNKNRCGKWMCFFNNKEFISKICEDAIKKGIVQECKHSDDNKGVSCFYLDWDDIKTHKKILLYFIENNLIQKTKSGKLYNISFKLNMQTRAGVYGDDFKAIIKLSDFVDLNTGEWLE